MAEKRKIDWDEKKVGLVIIALLAVSTAGILLFGAGSSNLLSLAGFSVAIAAAAVLFGDWFDKAE